MSMDNDSIIKFVKEAAVNRSNYDFNNLRIEQGKEPVTVTYDDFYDAESTYDEENEALAISLRVKYDGEPYRLDMELSLYQLDDESKQELIDYQWVLTDPR